MIFSPFFTLLKPLSSYFIHGLHCNALFPPPTFAPGTNTFDSFERASSDSQVNFSSPGFSKLLQSGWESANKFTYSHILVRKFSFRQTGKNL
jgi:hypothetical protein